ncbi:hypothetical protein KGQ27_00320 [Patescibacteria group bacterium]|nr:hypothetical protein [Patescibacteria group bacterium]MDE1946661.1 hypothetical protein [Patescibacteria group bacterium]MDE2010614.1 hypothetical protein [Patescibacteria group bacterium]
MNNEQNRPLPKYSAKPDTKFQPQSETEVPPSGIADVTEQETDAPPEHIFEISPDFDIKPIGDTDEQVPDRPNSIQNEDQPNTALQDEIKKMNIEAVIHRTSNKNQGAMPQIQQPTQSAKQPVKQPLKQSIPISDLSQSIAKAQKTPETIPKTATDMIIDQPKPLTLGEDGQPIIEKFREKEGGNFVQKALRTYEGDVAGFMAHRKASVASMVVAENKKGGEQGSVSNEKTSHKSSHTGKKLLLLILSLILIGIGSIGSYYLYYQSPLSPKTVTPIQQANTEMIPVDAIVSISVDGLSANQIISRVQAEIAKPQAPNTVKAFDFTEISGNQTLAVTGPEMLRLMNIPVPDSLARTITDQWMFGVYAGPDGTKQPFVIVTTNYFQNAFAGMLAWESVMTDDLKQYLPIVTSNLPVSQSPIASTTATTTMGGTITSSTTSATVNASSTNTSAANLGFTMQYYLPPSGKFVDRIVHNKDVREFQTGDGRTLFLYSFVDNSKLVFSGGEASLSEIVSRLEQQSFMR